MEQLLVELERLSRDINAQIDTKFAKLERSIADADKRIPALRILIDEAKKLLDESTPAAAHSPAAPTAAPAPADGRDLAHDERHRRVYELADQDKTPMQIASELDQTVGEVELILNLRRSAADNDSTPTRPT